MTRATLDGCWVLVAKKLNYHRLKPGGVPCVCWSSCSREIELPPAEAGWCPVVFVGLVVVVKLNYHRLKPGGVQLCLLVLL